LICRTSDGASGIFKSRSMLNQNCWWMISIKPHGIFFFV